MVNSNATLAVDQKPPARKTVVISKKSFKSMVEHLLKQMEVVGVKSKQGKFIYDRISSFDELCMDYSVTIISPTKYLLPARETILKLTANVALLFTIFHPLHICMFIIIPPTLKVNKHYFRLSGFTYEGWKFQTF